MSAQKSLRDENQLEALVPKDEQQKELDKKEDVLAVNNDFVYKEGKFGWIVVIATGYCFGVLIGMVNNYSLILNELDRVYNETENHVLYSAWIGSVSIGVQYSFCSIGSVLTDLFGPRVIGLIGGLISTISLFACIYIKSLKWYFLTYGLFFGIGQALLITSTLAILPHYFKKRLSLANGIMNLIGAIIVVSLSIAISRIINHYGLVGIFYFLSALNFITFLMSFTYKPQLKDDKHEKKLVRFRKSFGLKILKKKKFVAWCVASFIGSFGWLIPIVNIDHYSIHAFPDKDPVLINIIFGASSGIAALVVGKIGDLTKFNRVHYHTIGYFIFGIFQLAIPFATNFYVMLFLLFVLGLCDGVLLCFIVTISFDLAESSKLANHGAGYFHVLIGPSTILGPAIAGKIFEVYHRYDYAFFFGGVTCLSASIILIIFFVTFYFLDKNKMAKKNGRLKNSNSRQVEIVS